MDSMVIAKCLVQAASDIAVIDKASHIGYKSSLPDRNELSIKRLIIPYHHYQKQTAQIM